MEKDFIDILKTIIKEQGKEAQSEAAVPQAAKPAPQSSMTVSSSSLYSLYQFVLGYFDWINKLDEKWKGNRGKGYLIVAMDITTGEPDIKNAKLIFDGTETLIIRNNKQLSSNSLTRA
jgi:hypothetical protein